MSPSTLAFCVLACCLMAWSSPAQAAGLLPAGTMLTGTDDTDSAPARCRAATHAAESALHVPDAFLAAIAKVESGRTDPATGTLAPWPWTVNAEGAGSFYATKEAAVAAVRALQARGVRSIDVGCLQVNLLHHPDAFASLEQAFDPGANALYAAGFLVSLFGQTGSWPLAAAAYHSQTPTVGAPYERRVLAEWATPDKPQGGQAAHRPARPSHEAGAGLPAPGAAGAIAAAGPPPGAVSPIGRISAMPRTTLPAVGGGVLQVGRSLAAYRLLPTRLAFRLARPG